MTVSIVCKQDYTRVILHLFNCTRLARNYLEVGEKLIDLKQILAEEILAASNLDLLHKAKRINKSLFKIFCTVFQISGSQSLTDFHEYFFGFFFQVFLAFY